MMFPRFLIKGAAGNYEFDGKTFTAKVGKSKYLWPVIGYLTFSLPPLLYLSFSLEIIHEIGLVPYLVLLPFVVAIFGTVVWISLSSIRRISKARHLEAITRKSKKTKGMNKDQQNNSTKGAIRVQ